MSTFAQLKTRVQESASLTSADATTVGEFVNDAYRDFCRDAGTNPVELAYTLTADQDEYDLDTVTGAAGVLRFLNLTAKATGERATRLDVFDNLEELADRQERSDTTGKPEKAYLAGLEKIVLYPTPDAAYTLGGWYVPRPAAMSADADTPNLPVEYHRALWYRATQLAIEWDRQGDDEAARWEQRYMQQVGLARRAKTRMHGSRPRALRPASSRPSRVWPPAPFGDI